LVATLTRTATCSPPDTPYGPFPADGATNQSINVDLNWADAPGAASYDVYFGTSTSPPWYATTSASKHALPLLSSSTHYYWKIVAKNSCGEAAGPVWDFTTAGGETFLTIHLPILLR
jgi:hypothetical protein